MAETSYLTRSEAAALAGVSTRTVDRWANEKRITRYRQAGLRGIRFKRTEVEAILEPVAVLADPFGE